MKYKQLGFIGIDIDEAIKGMLITGFIAGAILCSILWLIIPWIWSYLKPFLHSITA